MISRFRTFIAGFLVLLPLAVTHRVIVWVGSFIYAYLGPDSAIGRVLISIGFNFSNSPIAAYALGAVVVVGLVYLLGLVVESRLESRVRSLIDSLMQRIPFVGNLYDVTKRFVAIMDRKDQDGDHKLRRWMVGEPRGQQRLAHGSRRGTIRGWRFSRHARGGVDRENLPAARQ